MAECIDCERAARRMLSENVETQCESCGARFSLDAEVIEIAAPAEIAAAPALPRPAPRRSRAELLAALSPKDRAKVEHEADTAARWERVRRVVNDLIAFDATTELNEKSASACTSQSNWLRGALAVGSDVYEARPELRAYQKNPVVFGPGHNGSVGAMASMMPDFTIRPVDPRTLVRLNGLRASRPVAAAVRKDGQGDRTLHKTLLPGRAPVSLTLEQRIGLEVAPADVLANWWRQIQRGHYTAMLAGSSTYGTRALFELEAEWFAVPLDQHSDLARDVLRDARIVCGATERAIESAMRREANRVALAALDAFGSVLALISEHAQREQADEKTRAVF